VIPEEDRTGADLNEIYMDDKKVGADRRTSLIVDPPNGKVPPLVKAAQDRNATLGGRTREPSRVRRTNDSRSVVKPSAGSDQAT
jgi:hypothetical protein